MKSHMSSVRVRSVAATTFIAALLLSACGATEADTEGESGDESGTVDESLWDCVPGANSEDITGQEPEEDDTDLTIPMFNGWDDNLVSAHMLKYMLEEHGYSVTVESYEPAPGFTGVAAGDLDFLPSSMLPVTHDDYLDQYGDDLEVQGCWYGTATNEISVTEDSPAQSIEDLAEMGDEYGNQIVGIEPGAGLMRMTENAVMPAYGMEDWTLIESSTPAMLAAVQDATNSGESIAVTLWSPHWAYESLPLRKLEDPENAFGEPELFFQLSRTGFTDDHPLATQILQNFVLDEETMGSIQSLMAAPEHYDGQNPTRAVEEWAADNPEYFDAWERGELGAGGTEE